MPHELDRQCLFRAVR